MRNFNHLTTRVLLPLVCILLVVSCGNDQPNKRGKRGAEQAKRAIPVATEVAKVGPAKAFYVTTATLTPNSDAQINARTSGVVTQILREEGDQVKAGEVLLLLEDDDQKLRLKLAEQKLESSKREFNRLNKMKNAGAVSPNEWETVNSAYSSATIEYELAKLALDYTRISAPFDGTVVWREVDLGAYVANGQLLYRIMSVSPLLVKVYVPANRVANVKSGQQVELTVDSVEQPLLAEVDLVSPIVDPNTGTVKVTLKLENYPQGVRPGDFAEVKLVTEKRDQAMLLPTVALIEERGSFYVFVEKDGKAVRKNVEIGFVVDDLTEIVAGLEMTDQVVVKGQRNLNDGNLIQVMNKEGGSASQTADSGNLAKPKSRSGKDS
ncbi:efflux RND transporter periplasmic adaptor subunit [Aliikangiella sp. IMCC44632]